MQINILSFIPSLNHTHWKVHCFGLYNILDVVDFVLCISLCWRPPSQQRSLLWLLQRLEGLQQLLAPSTPPQVPPPEMFLAVRGAGTNLEHDLLHNIYHWVETVQGGLVPSLCGSAAMSGKLEVKLRFGLRKPSKLVAGCRQMNHHFSHLNRELSKLGLMSIRGKYPLPALSHETNTVTAVEQRRQW